MKCINKTILFDQFDRLEMQFGIIDKRVKCAVYVWVVMLRRVAEMLRNVCCNVETVKRILKT